MSRLFSSLLLSLGIASSAAAVAMDWTPIGDPGNACDPQGLSFGELICLGSVGYSYNVGTYEVTNAQYAEFLNAKAAADPLGLYDTAMSSTVVPYLGGITRSGSPGSYTYGSLPGARASQ